MPSPARTPAQYLASLPADSRAAVSKLRKAIRDNLDAGYEEGIQYGMLGYYVPHRVYPAGYHADPKQPLPYISVAAKKNGISLYMTALYFSSATDPASVRWFQDAWKRTGKRLDMGKACVRIKSIDDVPLDVVGEAVRRLPAKKFIGYYEKAVAGRAKPAKKTKTKAAKSTRSG
jgi:hypothetical protein